MIEDKETKSTKESNARSAHTNKVLAITCVSILFFFLIIIGFGFYLTTRDDNKTNSSQNKDQSNALVYSNTEGKFTVNYPKGYTKEEDSNGMDADFTSPDATIILRAFYIFSSGKTASEYLNGIFQLSQKSMPLRTVTEIDSSSHKLGSLDGQMRVWKYTTSI